LLYLTGSIVLTSYLILSFKAVERFRIPVFQAIVFNYLTCVVTGIAVNGSFPFTGASVSEPWFGWAMVMGTLFISLFNVIGITTQKLGVSVASVANKLSLVIPFVFSIYLYQESVTWIKVLGVVVALLSVLLTCWPSRSAGGSGAKNIAVYFLPALLFFGSGGLDTLIKWVEHSYLNETNNNAYLIASFGAAAAIGVLLLFVGILTKRMIFDRRSIVAGIAIGIPNYFSIWCLVKVLKQYQDNSSAIIPINNMGIVLFSAVMALWLFKEKLSRTNWIGILLAVGAIAMIAFG
jgi:drug/metabolite transporter (DMT)-like permease